MSVFPGAIIETSVTPHFIFNIGVFADSNWDEMVAVWPQFEPTQYIKRLDELEPSDGYTGPICVGAIQDEFGKWYDPTWVEAPPEEQAAKLAAVNQAKAAA